MMWIEAEGIGPDTKISGVPIKAGRHKYNLDSKDPLTAIQLKSLLEMKMIKFDDTLDEELVKKAEDALNNRTLEIKTHAEFNRKGSLKNIPSKVEYRGSKLPEEKVKNEPTGSAAKSTKKSRKDND